MRTLSRRVVLANIAALAIPLSAHSGFSEELNADAADGSVAMTRYAADRVGRRPAVLILHGTRGVELKPRAYERYANALAAAGVDAYLVRYLTAVDYQALGFDWWTRQTSSVVTAIVERPDSSSRIGLLGFSLGGYVAADTAAHDQRITAIAVMYGGMPDAMVTVIKHMPPLIELHGEADHNVPLAKGQELVNLARAVGA